MSAPVVLVHGLRTSATMWRYQVERLTALAIPVRTVELPGHGTRMAERFTLDGAIAAIDEAVRDAVDEAGEPAFLVGFSLGGYLSLRYAGMADAPPPIRGLLAASCGTTPARAVLEPYRLAANLIHRLPDRGAAMNEFFVRAFIPRPGADDVLAGGAAVDVMDDVLRALRGLGPTASVRRITVPIWFVNGQFDHFRLQERRFVGAARDARLVHIRGANHMVSVTRPDEFTDVLLGALEETGVLGSPSKPPATPNTA
jgi:pimeloyl-ACP methyl ester carboxylesterase